jgi:hypothetical protein
MEIVVLDTKYLYDVYERMVKAYREGKSREEGVEAALGIFQDHLTGIQSIQSALNKVMDFYHTLVEAERAYREAREQAAQGGLRSGGHGCFVWKLVPCGKQCNGCPHGPYLYQVTKSGGKQLWKYLGRASA